MKTLPTSEVESLRAQVRELRSCVADLEDRLAEYESEEEDDRWAIWPYCYVVAGWNAAHDCFHSVHTKLNKVGLARHNRRQIKLESGSQLGNLHLT